MLFRSTAAALTIGGLIFSGGNVARFDPSNPLGSLAGAVQGTGQTIANVGNVITGQTGISTPTTTGGGGGGAAGAGTPSSGTGAGAQGTGEQSTNIGTFPILGGGLGGGGGAAGQGIGAGATSTPTGSATGDVQTTTSTPSVIPSNVGLPSSVGSGPKEIGRAHV